MAMSHTRRSRLGLANLGFGVGLRTPHLPDILSGGPRVDWFEIISENYMDHHGYGSRAVDELAERVPFVLHGVSLSIGSTAALDREYLSKLKRLAARVRAAWVSDHLCWTGLGTHNSHDLLPLPLTEGTLRHVAQRVREVQDALERPLVMENPSTYIQYRASSMPECEFLARLADRADCGILLDVNNLYVNAHNHRFDPEQYIRALPHDRIVQMHVAGPTDCGEYLVDTHAAPVPARVWELFVLAQRLTGGVSTLLEWDAEIPAYQGLLDELGKARLALAGEMPMAAPLRVAAEAEALSTPIDFHLEHAMKADVPA
jgi:uncharacterized protein (UPF0276 family)